MKSKIKIDSLKLTFPRNSVQIIDEKFAQEYQKIYINTGEIDTESVSLDKHKVEQIKGISSRIALGQWVMGDNINEVLFLQINAKMCRELYFDGINWNNWKLVYNHIMQQRVIYMDERTFLNGMVTDIDFAFDFKATPKELSEVITMLYSKVLPERHKFVSAPFRQKTNVGIQFNKREKATPSKPFIKIYHKGLELQYKSEEFGRTFLTGQKFKEVYKKKNQDVPDWKNTSRLEVTLKNSRDKKYHGLNQLKDMKDLLDLSDKEREKIVFSGLPKYLNRASKIHITDEVSPTDRYIIWMIDLLMKHGYGKAALFQGLDIFEDKQQKHRIRKKLEKIVDAVPDQNKLESNRRIDNILLQLKVL